MYAIIYVFIFQIVIFNYISMSTQSDSTAVISENIFPSFFNNTKSGNPLKQILNISNSDEGNNPQYKSNNSLIYTTEKIELSDRGFYNLALKLDSNPNCMHTAIESMLQLAKDSVQCLIDDLNAGNLKKDFTNELSGDCSTMKKEMKSMHVSKKTKRRGFFNYLKDLPKKIYNYLTNKVKNFLINKILNRFFNQGKCTSKLLKHIKKTILDTLLTFGACLFTKVISK